MNKEAEKINTWEYGDLRAIALPTHNKIIFRKGNQDSIEWNIDILKKSTLASIKSSNQWHILGTILADDEKNIRFWVDSQGEKWVLNISYYSPHKDSGELKVEMDNEIFYKLFDFVQAAIEERLKLKKG